MLVAFFLVALVSFIGSLNAVRPPVTHRSAAVRPPWLWAMLASELAPARIVVVSAVGVAAVVFADLASPLGWVAVVLGSGSVLLSIWLVVRGARGWRAMRSALGEGVDLAPRRVRVGSVFVPFPYRIPASVERLDGLEYASGLCLDLYRRRDRDDDPAPLLVHVHGGSWSGGSRRQQARPLIHEMARRGWLVASADYPFVPEATFPDQLIALHAALAWLRNRTGELGIDPARVFVTGGSAGGHLASLLALTDGHEEWSSRRGDEPPIAGAVTLYGIYDLLDRNEIRDFWPIVTEHLIKADPLTNPELFHAGSPIDHVTEDSPPFLVLHGTHDSLVPIAETEHFVAALRARSRPVVFAAVPGATHAFDVVPSLRTQLVVAGIAAFLEAVAGATWQDGADTGG